MKSTVLTVDAVTLLAASGKPGNILSLSPALAPTFGTPGAASAFVQYGPITRVVANAIPATIFTITCPVGIQSAVIQVWGLGMSGPGGAVGEGESCVAMWGFVVITRAVGKVMQLGLLPDVSDPAALANATVPAGNLVDITQSVTVPVGAVGAVNTASYQVVITRTAGAATAHTYIGMIQTLNIKASGIVLTVP